MKIVGTRKPDRKRTPETPGRRQVLRLAAMGAVSLAAGEVSLAASDTAALANRGVLDVVIIGAGLAGLTANPDHNARTTASGFGRM